MRAPGWTAELAAVRTRGTHVRHGAVRWSLVLALVVAAASTRAPPAVASLPSQTDGVIAYQRNDDAHGEIWLLDPSQSAPESTAVKVSTDGAPEARPAWGPTWHESNPTAPRPTWDLAFQRYANGNWDIWKRTTVNPATALPTFGAAAALVTRPGNQEQPAYSDVITSESPETLLAYVSDETGRPEIWLRDATGALTQLTFDGAGYANPDFAARFRLGSAGRTIGLAFESTRGGPRRIWALDIDVDSAGKFVATHDLREVASGPEELSEPSWQVTNPPPATSFRRFNDVLFTTREAGSTYLDYVETPDLISPFADPAQSVRYRLTGDPGGDSGAVWAPFGDRVVFARTIAGDADLWVMSADGTDLRRLTEHAGRDVSASWQPAQESSADLVGGHTSPGPVTRTPRGGKPPGGNPPGSNPRVVSTTVVKPEVRRRSPRLAIRSARWHARSVTVAGRAARGLAGRVRVAFACGHRRAQHTQRRVRARSGRFGTRLRVPRACRRARRGLVAAAYGGDRGYRAQKVTRRVRRR